MGRPSLESRSGEAQSEILSTTSMSYIIPFPVQTEPRNFKARIRSGETLIGAFVCFRTGDAAEVMGYCGFDFLIMDSEHSSFGPEAVQELVRATEVTGAIPLVRVAEIRSSYVQ